MALVAGSPLQDNHHQQKWCSSRTGTALRAQLDASLQDVQFAVGDEVLLDTEDTPLPSPSLLFPRWMGPFWV